MSGQGMSPQWQVRGLSLLEPIDGKLRGWAPAQPELHGYAQKCCRARSLLTSLAFQPIFLEGLVRNRGKLAAACPGVSRIQFRALYQWMKSLQQAAGAFNQAIHARPVHHKSEQLESDFL